MFDRIQLPGCEALPRCRWAIGAPPPWLGWRSEPGGDADELSVGCFVVERAGTWCAHRFPCALPHALRFQWIGGAQSAGCSQNANTVPLELFGEWLHTSLEAHLQAHAASSHCLEPRCCLIHHDIDSSDRCALALQVFSIFDSAGAGDAEHIDEKLSTSCARWAAVCMRAVCSKRAWSAMQNLLPLCVSGCTHRIRAPPGHGYDVLCVACAFACVFMIPMRKIYQKLGRVRSNHKTMILRPWSVWSTYNLSLVGIRNYFNIHGFSQF